MNKRQPVLHGLLTFLKALNFLAGSNPAECNYTKNGSVQIYIERTF